VNAAGIPPRIEVHESADALATAVAGELLARLTDAQSSGHEPQIALTGGTAHLPGLAAELERLIGVPVRVIDPLSRVKVSKKVREREQVGSLAVAIGLGIED